MLIRELSDALVRDYPSDPEAKRSIFLANTVPLVKQQAEYLAKYTSFKVDSYYGEKKIDDRIVDLWDADVWANELCKNQVLVMSPQILVDCLSKNFIGLNCVFFNFKSNPHTNLYLNLKNSNELI